MGKTKEPIVFGEVTLKQAEEGRFSDVMTIMLPEAPKADFDLPGRPKADRDRLNEIAQRWREAYCGNFLKVREKDFHHENWDLYANAGSSGDCVITTNRVHASEMMDYDDIDEFVINAPEDVKWLLQLVLDLVGEEEQP